MLFFLSNFKFMRRLNYVLKKTPLLTVPLIRRLMTLVLPLKSLSVEGAMEIVAYHLRRNLTAYKSHRKKRLRLAKLYNINVAL